MGLNNCVRFNARPNVSWIQYKWGFVREIDYAIGERISWEGMQRPPEADGIVRVSGVAIRPFDETKVTLRQGEFEEIFFEIVFNDDRIESVREISEEDYNRLEAGGH